MFWVQHVTRRLTSTDGGLASVAHWRPWHGSLHTSRVVYSTLHICTLRTEKVEITTARTSFALSTHGGSIRALGTLARTLTGLAFGGNSSAQPHSFPDCND